MIHRELSWAEGSDISDNKVQPMVNPEATSLLAGAALRPSFLVGGEVTFLAVPFPFDAFNGLALTRFDGVASWFPAGDHLFLRGKAGGASLWMSRPATFFDTRSSNQAGLDLGAGEGLAQRLGASFKVTGALDLSGQ